MKLKPLIWLLALLTLSIGMAGCGDEVVYDLQQYLAQHDPLAQEQSDILAEYNKVVSSPDDDFVKTLNEDIIPQYTKLAKDIKAVKVETDELKEVHQIWIEASDTHLEALEKLRDGVEKKDQAKLEEGNRLLADGNKLDEEYQKKLVELGARHNFKLTIY